MKRSLDVYAWTGEPVARLFDGDTYVLPLSTCTSYSRLTISVFAASQLFRQSRRATRGSSTTSPEEWLRERSTCGASRRPPSCLASFRVLVSGSFFLPLSLSYLALVFLCILSLALALACLLPSRKVRIVRDSITLADSGRAL